MTPKNIASLKEFHDHRIELGIPLFGQDFGPTNSPLEIGLDEHCISFDKGCYVGQEVVARLRSRGKSVRILKRLHFAQDITPTPNATVTLPSGKEVGVITSSGWAGDHGIAYAVLRRSDAETADKVVAEGQEAEIGPAWGLFHGF
jgi:folate-binding protein YgfZ